MRLPVRVIPNAPKTAITGMRGDEMVLRVNAPASDGKANRVAIRFLARMFGVSTSSIQLVSGEKSRHKKFEIVGLESGEIREKLADLLGSNPL